MNEIKNSHLTSIIRPEQKVNRAPKEKNNDINNLKASVNQDKVEISKKQEVSVVYSNTQGKKKLEASDIDALIKEAEKSTEQLRKLVEKLILKQSRKQGIEQNKKADNEEAIKIQETSKATKAELSISEDGEFGIKAVSDRLVDFAIAVSGGDKSKLSQLISAIDSGFAAARESFGGELPDICNKTYDETMRKLNEWAKSE